MSVVATPTRGAYAASGIDMAVLGLGVGLGLVALLGVAALGIVWWLT